MKFVETRQAPAAIGPYSQAIIHNGLVYASGQIGFSPLGEQAEGVGNQTRQALENLSAVLDAAGSSLSKVLKVTIYLKDMDHFEVVNTIYAACFGDHRPARACVQAAALPKGALVEIDCVAAQG